MDTRHHHSATTAAADLMQVDQVINDSDLISAINNEPGTIHALMANNICPRLTTRDVAALARSFRFFHSICQPQLDELAIQALYQAIIDDDREQTRRILNSNPRLLLHAAPANHVIESKLTWQKFKLGAGDTPLAVAAKRKQIKMIKLLLPYYNQLVQDHRLNEASRQYASEAREAGLKAWSFYVMTNNAYSQDKILIPTKYSSVINKLINIFIDEKLADGQRDFTQLSENAERAIRSFLDRLVPEAAVELDNHVDVELLLLAAYQSYNRRFYAFLKWEQRDAFCIRVIGLIQSVLSPETAKIFCEGVYCVVVHKWPVEELTAAPKLFGGKSFYRVSRNDLTGLGGKYLCDVMRGEASERIYDILNGIESWDARHYLTLMLNKCFKIGKMMQLYQSESESEPEPEPEPKPEPSTWCVIF